MDEKKIITVAKSSMYLSISILMLVVAYLAFSNPALNYILAYEAKEKERKLAEDELSSVNDRNAKLKEWRWFGLGDVATDSEKYPIVVMRSGFKVIKIADERVLVGWRMDKMKGFLSDGEWTL